MHRRIRHRRRGRRRRQRRRQRRPPPDADSLKKIKATEDKVTKQRKELEQARHCQVCGKARARNGRAPNELSGPNKYCVRPLRRDAYPRATPPLPSPLYNV